MQLDGCFYQWSEPASIVVYSRVGGRTG
jgi:hypothetical protein